MVLQVERCVKSGNNLRQIRPVLLQWINVLNRYVEAYEGDCPWWYTERAVLSSFAAAAWLSDGIALEEYSTFKGKKSEKYRGRCDLFFSFGDHSFACEAKPAWCAIGRRAKSGCERVKSKLAAACAAALKLGSDEADRLLGLCFAMPWLPSADEDFIEEQIKEWLKKLISEVRYDSIAWMFPFPEKTRCLKGSDENFYPGVALLIKAL
jgi:hypothetical protein